MNQSLTLGSEPKAKTVQIFKNGSKWAAHLYWEDGHHWSYWLYNFKTKRAIISEIEAVCATAHQSPEITRGHDE